MYVKPDSSLEWRDENVSLLTLALLNEEMHLKNSVNPDQMASEEAI